MADGYDAQRDRPELKAALEYLRPGDTLVMWKLDRLARPMRQLIETVEDMQARGIELRSLTESIDSAAPDGRLVFHLLASLAEFERAVIRKRTSTRLQSARERGRKGGRPLPSNPKTSLPRKHCSPIRRSRWKKSPRLHVSPATLYRHLPGGRSTLAETIPTPEDG